MNWYQVLFFLLLSSVLAYDFNLTGPQNKLFTWVNSAGVEENLLLSQISVEKQTILSEIQKLPFDFQTDQNCALTESADTATLYQGNTRKVVTLEYTHMQGSDAVSKNTLEITTETSIKLTDEFTVNLRNSQASQDSNQSSPGALYLLNNKSLLQIDSKLLSAQPACFLLSQMTEKLCLQQNCAALSPFQLFDMEVGPLIKNFTLTKGVLEIPSQPNTDLQENILFGEIFRTISEEGLNQSLIVEEKIITFSENTVMQVQFKVSKASDSDPKTSLRSVSSSDSSNYGITILISNPKYVFAIKTINLYKGNETVLSDRLIIKPNQTLTYNMEWDGDKKRIPSVEILNESLSVESKYSLSFEITDQTTDQQLASSSNQDITTATSIEETQINEVHDLNKLNLIIGLASAGGTLILTIIFVWLCRKRIAKKCFSNEQEAKPELKKQEQADKGESGRHLNIEYEITFEKKPEKNIASMSTGSTVNKGSTISVENPEYPEQKREQYIECSFGRGDLAIFSRQTSSVITPVCNQNHEITDENRSQTVESSYFGQKSTSFGERLPNRGSTIRDDVSSLNSKLQESCTHKSIGKKRLIKKPKDQEHTEKI